MDMHEKEGWRGGALVGESCLACRCVLPRRLPLCLAAARATLCHSHCLPLTSQPLTHILTRPAGCPAATAFLPIGEPEVPRWAVTFKQGKSSGRHGCYGRVAYHEIVTTVRGWA